MAQDPVGQGERFGYYEEAAIDGMTITACSEEHDYAGKQCLLAGDSIARYFIHDAMRGIDYLCTRCEVDPKRIGVTGCSGGGTQTCMIMVCDPRIAAAAPANFLMSRESYLYAGGAQDAEQIWPGMTAYGFDHEDILLSMAPRPVLVNAVTSDFFPIEGTRRSVERARRFWEMYGKCDTLRMYEDNSKHAFTRLLAKNTAEFFSHFLAEHMISVNDKDIKPLDADTLWCTPSGQVKKEYKDARFLHEENCSRLAVLDKLKNSMTDAELRDRAISWLKETVWTARIQCSLNPRIIMREQVVELDVEELIWWSQESIFNHAYIIKDCRLKIGKMPVTLAIWDGGTLETHNHIDWVRHECLKGRAVLVQDVSGVGVLTPNPVNSSTVFENGGTIFKLADDLIWLGDSIASMRVYDVLKALDLINLWKGLDSEDIKLYANGRYGIYGKLAAFLDNRIKSFEESNGIGSLQELAAARYYDEYDIKSVIIPGILKYFDLPELDQWIKMKDNTLAV